MVYLDALNTSAASRTISRGECVEHRLGILVWLELHLFTLSPHLWSRFKFAVCGIVSVAVAVHVGGGDGGWGVWLIGVGLVGLLLLLASESCNLCGQNSDGVLFVFTSLFICFPGWSARGL